MVGLFLFITPALSILFFGEGGAILLDNEKYVILDEIETMYMKSHIQLQDSVSPHLKS